MPFSLFSHFGNYHIRYLLSYHTRTHRGSLCQPPLGQMLPSLHLCSWPEGQVPMDSQEGLQTSCPGSCQAVTQLIKICAKELKHRALGLCCTLSHKQQIRLVLSVSLKPVFLIFPLAVWNKLNFAPRNMLQGKYVCWSAADCKTGLFDSHSGGKKYPKQVVCIQKKSRTMLLMVNAQYHASLALHGALEPGWICERALHTLLASLLRACALISLEKQDLGFSPCKNQQRNETGASQGSWQHVLNGTKQEGLSGHTWITFIFQSGCSSQPHTY